MIEAASHPYQLTPSGLTWVTIDTAQRGIGSHHCGPPLPSRYRVEPVATRMALRFTASPSATGADYQHKETAP
jgi:hypothetical protein